MFENLTSRLQEIFRKLRGKGKLTEKDIEEALREVRQALLEADAHYKVVKELLNNVKTKALQEDVLKSVTPAEQIIRILYYELLNILGGEKVDLNLGDKKPGIILVVGLQGSGKTTTCAKLAYRLSQEQRRVLLVGADTFRPAAGKQLQILGEKIKVPVYIDGSNPFEIIDGALKVAREKFSDVMIVDTTGRLHIDEEMMNELSELNKRYHPSEILLVVDGMTGQDAVNIAEKFNEKLPLTGVILTKMDGDARGGAALSVKAITGKPIKFIGVGEKIEDLEYFYPDRLASRILGMGDLASLVEKIEKNIELEKMAKLEEKLKKSKFDLEDFYIQLKELKKVGTFEQILDMLPYVPKNKINVELSEKEIKKFLAIIESMTPEERRNPSIINGSRRQRIARGSGTSVQDVNRLLKQYFQTLELIKQINKGKKSMFPFFR
ncbi:MULTISPECIES: signal recognition particle protein [Dictyoglomus]|jgi:signal recognition particle subunit SRP54|uniref:Signal recognition particle protein n=1 Tax=Dictyoglomus turgidum (strain DSM 6724 / Z-1310) TaxID=515635 RepID=B8E2G8_DICTD|nr:MULTISPECIES: signal recognition particle protein [Dictyoglomus]ACK42812.1 signal recognition particle protein [Dictyoglomus turgidum DSM 6724]PNV80981.1 MAG: signal recognition particle protein [Dictyoglomus turgidum]HBU30871.1 signal recognition particle protein [Dictyoglomus sp.]